MAAAASTALPDNTYTRLHQLPFPNASLPGSKVASRCRTITSSAAKWKNVPRRNE